MANRKRTKSKSKKSFRVKKGFTILQAGLVAIVVALVGLQLLRPSAAVSGDHAKCISISSSKTSVKPRQTFAASVKVINDGSTTWTPQAGYRLVDPYNTWHFTGNVFNYSHPPDGKTGITFNLTLTAPSRTGTYRFGGRVGSNAKPSGFDQSCPVINVKVSNPTTPHPHPHPTPSPTPTPAPGGSSAPIPDTQPPTKPTNFSGQIDANTKLVTLSWQASKDNKGVAGYQLERSTDKHHWEVLSRSINKTVFEDPTADFGKHYYYRLKAWDQAGNSSGYVVTSVTSSDFQGNVKPDSDAQITSDDNNVVVTIPAGAVSADQFCSVTNDPNTTSPDIAGYTPLSEPYSLSCRDAAGETLQSYNKPLSARVQLNPGLLNGIGGVDYFGQNNDSWDKLKRTAHDKKNLVDQIDLGNHSVFALMGKPKKTSPLIGIFIVLIILAVIGFGVIFFLRWRMRSKLQKQYDDYRKRSIGG